MSFQDDVEDNSEPFIREAFTVVVRCTRDPELVRVHEFPRIEIPPAPAGEVEG